MNTPDAPPVRLLATSGTISVVICRLCAALVIVGGERQHDLAHRAQLLGAPEGISDGAE